GDLLRVRRSHEGAQCRGELGFVEPVVASNQSEEDLAVDYHGHRLSGRARVDIQELGDILDRSHAGRLDLFRRLESGRKVRRRGYPTGGLDVGRVVAVLAS